MLPTDESLPMKHGHTETREAGATATFSLLGGPLHRLGLRAGLIRPGGSTAVLGLAIGASLWAVLVVLALVDGIDLTSLTVIGGHVRLLVAIPLLFVAQSILDPRLAEFMRGLERAAIVAPADVPALQAEIARVTRWKESPLPEALCLLIAVLMAWLAPSLHIPGTTAAYLSDLHASEVTMTGWWYWTVCLTVFRFLMLRWLWRLMLWYHCLWRLSRFPLKLIPVHPDRAAGLGYLEVVHMHFAPAVLMISVVLAASFAEDIAAGRMAVESVVVGFGLILLLDFALFVAPLCLFSAKLWACRVKGQSDYMQLAERYVSDFDGKWVHPRSPANEPLLGSPDIQSLADLSTAVDLVRDMRLVPASLRLLLQIAITAALPLLPLLLFKYPFTELLKQGFARLTGF
jgi:hypothetical protein